MSYPRSLPLTIKKQVEFEDDSEESEEEEIIEEEDEGSAFTYGPPFIDEDGNGWIPVIDRGGNVFDTFPIKKKLVKSMHNKLTGEIVTEETKKIVDKAKDELSKSQLVKKENKK